MKPLDPIAPTIVAAVLWPGSVVLRGFVLAKLWLWFAVTTFGVPAIGIAQAIGLAMMLALITYQPGLSKDDRSPLFDLAFSALLSLFALAAGALVAWFL